MQILHISTECYPAAKAGGLGDVVGTLPKYLTKATINTAVVLPKYANKWIKNQQWETIYEDTIDFYQVALPFSIQRLEGTFAFPLFVVDIPSKFDRPGVYLNEDGRGYPDEVERAVSFQRAILQWLTKTNTKPQIIHCHDHHTGLIPFMLKHCPEFANLSNVPSIFTIHNAEYHGTFSWDKVGLLPLFDGRKRGLLDWGYRINPLATAIKCTWKLTTVSPSYMQELRLHTRGLEKLLQQEEEKSLGILNGIDVQVWNPSTDPFIDHPLRKSVDQYKFANKSVLLKQFNVPSDLPIITFIGRLAREKGADFLAPVIDKFLSNGGKAGFIILGTGEPILHQMLLDLKEKYQGIVDVALEYNEKLAHQLYAGSDFLWMPSRVEPCGLNQLYAMRYGTIPIVRSIGGLKDTVIDIASKDGSGIQFKDLTIASAAHAVKRAANLYNKKSSSFKKIRTSIMKLDFSWEKSAADYIALYKELTSLI